MKRNVISVFAFAGLLVLGAAPLAQAKACSNASLNGGYGFSVGMSVLPAGTLRAVLGILRFDGNGNFTNTLTINDNGTVTHATDSGTYTVNADCMGTIFTNGGTRTVEFVLVDGGNELYEIRTDPNTLVFIFNAAKKQFPNDGREQQR